MRFFFSLDLWWPSRSVVDDCAHQAWCHIVDFSYLGMDMNTLSVRLTRKMQKDSNQTTRMVSQDRTSMAMTNHTQSVVNRLEKSLDIYEYNNERSTNYEAHPTQISLSCCLHSSNIQFKLKIKNEQVNENSIDYWVVQFLLVHCAWALSLSLSLPWKQIHP